MSLIESSTAPVGPEPGRWQAWLARCGRHLAYTRYHGIWTPGVRWLRNLQLPVKAVVVLVCLLLPLLLLAVDVARHRWAQWHMHESANLGLLRFQAAAELTQALHGLGVAVFQAQATPKGPAAAPAASPEAQAFDKLQQALGPQVSKEAELAAAWELLQQRRARFLDERRGADAQTAQASVSILPSLQAYQGAVEKLRRQLAQAWTVQFDDDPRLGRLRDAVIVLAPELWDRLGPLTGQALLLAQASDHYTHLRLAAEHLGAIRLAMSNARPAWERVRQDTLIDPALMDEVLHRIDQHLQSVDTLLQAAQRPAQGDGAGLAGVPALPTPLVVQESGARVVEAVATLYQAALKAQALHSAAEDEQRRDGLRWLVGLVLFGVLAGGYVLVCVYKVTAGGLRTLGAHLDQLGQGNLSIRPQGWGTDEVGRALNALGAAAAQMSHLFEAVSQGVSAVSLASRGVAEGNAGLSCRTGDIRHAIGDVADRAGDFSSAMDRCARQVEEAAELVRAMQGDAQRSRKAMATLRTHMQGLQAKSRAIEKTVGLVESVAYQTKLLSINASVEAARAGSAGKGFAVVAQEVRALAQRSEDAARRIHEIVSSSVTEIEDSHLVTERANTAVSSTDQKIVSIHLLMSEIVQLTREGMTGSQAVLEITRQVEDSADGNAQFVDQLSQASAALRNQGDSLKRSVQHFVFG